MLSVLYYIYCSEMWNQLDALTGLLNQNSYLNRTAEMRRSGGVLVVFDVDDFKRINDELGHAVGDEALWHTADILRGVFGKDPVFLARYGGDEFVLIYSGMSEEETYRWAEHLKQMILRQAVEHKYSKAAEVLTISQGICWGVPVEENKVWDYLHAADELLYQVKKVSRNSIRLGHLGDVERFANHD